MKRSLIWYLKISLFLGLAISLVACGGGGGSGAAPTGGGSTPVAVEIPALGTVSGLPFASGVVVSGSSSISAAIKATPGSWVYKTFTLTDNNAFSSGDSTHACHFRNQAAVAIGTFALPDQTLCQIKDNIGSFSAPYDGNYHILSTGASMAGIPAKIRFKISRNSNNIITSYEEWACDSTNTQITYVSYSISGSALTASMQNISSSAQPQRSSISLSGTLSTSDPTQYTAKTGVYSYTGTNNAGIKQGYIDMTQGTDFLLLNTFDSSGGGANLVRQYARANQSNSSSPLKISLYTYSAGASVVVDNGTNSTECWDTNNDPTTCSGSNYDAVNGKTPVASSQQTEPAFSSTWDCSGTAEASATFSSGDGSCFSRFTLDSDYINCTVATQGYLTVTPSVNGTTLSTSSGSPTSVSATPTILVTASLALDTDSANSSTVTLVNTGTNASVSLTYTNNWSSDYKTLTLSPTLTSGQTYKLTLVGSSTTATRNTVLRAPSGGEPPADQLQSTGTYYITAQ